MNPKKSGYLAVFALAAVAFASGMKMLYVLSVGPFGWLMQHNYLSPGTMNIIYGPLDFFIADVPVFQELILRYGRFWCDMDQVQYRRMVDTIVY